MDPTCSATTRRVVVCLLFGWIAFCLGWVVCARAPWQTEAFNAALRVKDTPRDDFMHAGVWIGLFGSGLLGLGLLATRRWWLEGGVAEGSVTAPVLAGPRIRHPWWWWGVMFVLVGSLFWRCRPAMTHSLWGDESMMFVDNIHGRWGPDRKSGTLQGPMEFRAVPWNRAFFYDPYGANHWLGTHSARLSLMAWQKLSGQPKWRFEEWVVRLVPLAAGIGAVVALGGWLAAQGRPLAGLVAAAFLSLHPLHLRFCAEVRGYSLMGCFFVLTLWAATRAVRQGRRRDWGWLAVLQFATLYSWKGALYPLLAVNVVLGFRLVFGAADSRRARLQTAARWVAAGMLGAMAFLPLAVPSELQIRKSIEETRKRAKPMDAAWRDNLAALTVVGMPWRTLEPAGPRVGSVEQRRDSSPAAWLMIGAIVVCLPVGAVRLWRQDRLLAWMVVTLGASGVAAALHFKYLLRVELLIWYLYYLTPVAAVLIGVALTPNPEQGRKWARLAPWGVSSVALLAGFFWLTGPTVVDWQRWPHEDYAGAVRMTRGVHEPPGHAGDSSVFTCWFWRHSPAYDPRGDTHARSVEALEAKCREAERRGGQVYVMVGMRELTEGVYPEVMRILHDPRRFERVTTLWGWEPVNTLDVYRKLP